MQKALLPIFSLFFMVARLAAMNISVTDYADEAISIFSLEAISNFSLKNDDPLHPTCTERKDYLKTLCVAMKEEEARNNPALIKNKVIA